MKDFLMLLLFSKVVLLSEGSVDLTREQEFYSEIEAVSKGAAIYIELVDLESGRGTTPVDVINCLKEQVKPEFIYGKISSAEEELILDQISYSYTDDSVLIGLTAESGIPVGMKFTKSYIYSRLDIKNVKIFWKNFKM